jgi:hypothetical protein
VLLVVGPDETPYCALRAKSKWVYEPLPASLDVRDSITTFFDYNFGKGDPDSAFANADKVYQEEFETGYQERRI